MRLSAVPFAALVVYACGGPQDAGGEGAECFRDDECDYGLICAAPRERSRRVCTDDVSGLVSEVEIPVGGAPGAPGSANGGAGGAGAGGAAGGTSVNGGAPSAGGSPPNAGSPSMPSAGSN